MEGSTIFKTIEAGLWPFLVQWRPLIEFLNFLSRNQGQ